MRRNRIVINLDADRPPRKRGRLGKVLLVVGLILLLIAGGLSAGGYFWWQTFQNGPSYSLALLVDAVQRNDTAAVDKILDTDKISSDFVAQVRGRTGSLAATLWSTQADAITATVSPKFKETLHEQLMNELRERTEMAKGKPLFIVALGVPYFAEIKQENNLAYATVNLHGEQIKLTMQNVDNRWHIIAVQDEKLAKMVADAALKNLPASGALLPDPLRKQLDKRTRN